jgi:mannose-1-phosphate guanylyltransferase
LERALKLAQPSHIFIDTTANYVSLIRKIARSLPSENIIGDPIRRDTAMAHGVGALFIYQKDPQAVIVNLASDHLISPLSTFISQVRIAAKFAYENNYIITIGIKPKYAHTGMGHIKASQPWLDMEGVLIGTKFVEKPPLEMAQKYTDSGEYFWNANLYIYKAKLFLDLLKKYSPKTTTLYSKLLEARGTSLEKQVMQTAYQMAPTISIDYAVSEHLSKFACLPSRFNWTDVGDWNEVWKNLPKDSQGNVIEGPKGKGEYIGINSKNNLLFLDKKIVATVGIQDMLIIDTPNALLICPKEEAQGVKQVVQALKDQDLTQYL